MASIYLVPLFVVFLGVASSVGISVSSRANRAVTKIAVMAFGSTVDTRSGDGQRKRLLQSAFIGTPYRVYESKTLLYSFLAGAFGSVLGLTVVMSLVNRVPSLIGRVFEQALGSASGIIGLAPVSDLGAFGLILAIAVSGGLTFLACWVATYRLRWIVPRVLADSRADHIDLSTPQLVAFLYALARGGLEVPEILQILRDRQEEFGEAGREMAVSSKSIEYFGVDSISAIKHVSHRTPSDQFRIFTENFASVLQSGRGISTFLGDQYEQFQEEGEKQQGIFLDRLGAIAEGYVALLVVGPLFLITVLLIFGLISGGTEATMAVIVYGFIPLSNIAFIVYLDRTTRPFDLSLSGRVTDDHPEGPFTTPEVQPVKYRDFRTDGGESDSHPTVEYANAERLVISDHITRIRKFFLNPLTSVRRQPTTIFYGSIPLASIWFGWNAYRLWRSGSIGVSTMDDVIVVSTLISLAPFAVGLRYYRRRQNEINNVVPDFLNRLASLNEAGLEIVEAFDQVRRGDLGPLTPELERIWIDINYGLNVDTALHRMERRLRSPSVSQAITLILNGMKSSNQIGPVLRIAADESRRLRSLRQEREQEMSIYLIITYLSFFVFLTIVYVLIATFIPAIPSAEVIETRGLSGRTAGITQEQVGTFTTLLFHASLIQGFFSGLVSGQMSQGSIQYGTTHVVFLLTFAYLLFTVVI